MHALHRLARLARLARAPRARVPARRACAAATDNCFHLLGLPERFALDAAALSARHRTLQAEWHPDKFATRPAAEQTAAAAMSARLNAAHDVLARPHRRARHLLALRDPGRELDDVRPAPDFLAWVMSFRETVEDASGSGDDAALARLRTQLRERQSDTIHALDAAFGAGDMHDAAHATAKLQYIHSIASAIDDVPLD